MASYIPSVFLPYQQKLQKAIDENKVVVVEKSRRTGYSWAMATIATLIAGASKDSGGQDVFYLSYNKSITKEFIDYVGDFARDYGVVSGETEEILIKNEDKDIQGYVINFASGFKVLALPSVPRALRGTQGVVIIDEAAFIDDLDEVLKSAFALLIWGGKVIIISTHNGDDNPFNNLISEIKTGKKPYKLLRCTLEDALNDGLYKRICYIKGLIWSKTNEDKWVNEIRSFYGNSASEELDCIPSKGTGAYFSRIILENCMQPGIPILKFNQNQEFVLNKDRLKVAESYFNDVLKPVIDNMDTTKKTYLGQDFGRDGDLSVVWILQEESATTYKTSFIFEMRRIPFDVQQFLLFKIIDDLPLFYHGKLDARGNGQSHAEALMQRYTSVKIDCVKATSAWYEENIPKYRQAYEDKSLIVPTSEDIIADHRLIVLNKGKPTMSDLRIKGSDGEYRHGDSAIAGLLAYIATKDKGVPSAGVSNDFMGFTARRGNLRERMFYV